VSENEIELPEGHALIESLGDKPNVLTPEGKLVPLSEFQPAAPQMWIDAEPEAVVAALERRSTNRTLLMNWIRTNLKEGVDYGVIKQKKSLWKPGAEKITGMLGIQVRWPDLHEELDRLRETGAKVMFLSCELIRDGAVQAQGAGARSVDLDGGDWNKCIKMCKKSAMIDAVLNVGGLSEVFTQDFEDGDEDLDKSFLSLPAQEVLTDLAKRCAGDQAGAWLESLARRRFHIEDGDYRKIPSFRLNDALRSIQEKYDELVREQGEIEETQP